MSKKIAIMYFQYADGGIATFELSAGVYVIGIAGGPADIHLESQNLSRRHASLTVGASLSECFVEDLGSTNKTSFVSEDESLFTLEPNLPYGLEQTTELLFGDVGAIFEFRGDDEADVASSLSKQDDFEGGSRSERWNRTRKSSRSVEFTVPDSEIGSDQTRRRDDNVDSESRPSDTRLRPFASTALSETTQTISDNNEGKIEHRLVYEHAREALGMDLPYDHELLWIAEMSLKMHIPEGWTAISATDPTNLSGCIVYRNEAMQLEINETPQTIICRNMYKETKRKMQLEAALGSVFEEDSLPRLLVVDRPSGLDLFHYILPGRNVIGKGFKSGSAETVDIVLNSRACSKRHGCLELRDGRFFLTDLESTNGTFNGELPDSASRRIEPGVEHEVFDAQLIMFGDVEASLVAPLGAAAMFDAAATRSQTAAHDGPAPAASDERVEPSPRDRPGPTGPPVGRQVETGARPPAAMEDDAAGPSASLDRSDAGLEGGAHGPAERTKAVGHSAAGPSGPSARSAAPQAAIVAAGESEPARPSASQPSPSPHARAAAAAPGSVAGGSAARPTSAAGSAGEGRDSVAGTGGAAGGSYDVEEELRLAEELSAAEQGLRGTGLPETGSRAAGAAAEKGDGGGRGRGARVPSKQEGYMTRAEARARHMLDWARRYYRRQTPGDALGAWVLPPGALHRVLAGLSPVPHLVMLAAVCRSLRAATYATQPTVTVNGDECAGLWSRLRLCGTRCGDAHRLLAGLGAERLGSVTELDVSGVGTVTDETLAAVAESCPLLEVLLQHSRAPASRPRGRDAAGGARPFCAATAV